MKGEAQVFLTLAAAVLAPTPLSAQDSGMNRTLSPDSILARFEKGATTTGGAPGARDGIPLPEWQRKPSVRGTSSPNPERS